MLAALAADAVSLASVSSKHWPCCIVFRVEFCSVQISDVSVVLACRQICWDELGLVDILHDFFDLQLLVFWLGLPVALRIFGFLLFPFLLSLVLMHVVDDFRFGDLLILLDILLYRWIQLLSNLLRDLLFLPCVLLKPVVLVVEDLAIVDVF